MPTYRYRCEQCGDELEVWQSFADEPLSVHDDACGGRLMRVLTPAGIVFKGPGFHKTDSRSGNGSRKSTTKDKESSSDGGSSSQSDSKSGSSGSGDKAPASSGSGSSGSGSGESGSGGSRGSGSSAS